MTVSALKGYGLLLGIVAGAVLGTFLGTLLPGAAVRTEILGELFLNALKMMVLPLIVTSMIVGVTNLGDMRRLGSLGVRTLIYYMTTTGLAAAVGITAVLVIRPGAGMGRFLGKLPERIAGKGELSILDVLSGLIHPNLVQAAVEMKILPIIVASLFFGAAIAMSGERGELLVRFFSALNDVVMKIVHGILFFAPVGIFGLIAHRLGSAGGGDAVYGLVLLDLLPEETLALRPAARQGAAHSPGYGLLFGHSAPDSGVRDRGGRRVPADFKLCAPPGRDHQYGLHCAL